MPHPIHSFTHVFVQTSTWAVSNYEFNIKERVLYHRNAYVLPNHQSHSQSPGRQRKEPALENNTTRNFEANFFPATPRLHYISTNTTVNTAIRLPRNFSKPRRPEAAPPVNDSGLLAAGAGATAALLSPELPVPPTAAALPPVGVLTAPLAPPAAPPAAEVAHDPPLAGFAELHAQTASAED